MHTETCKRNSVAELDQKKPVKDDYPGSPHQRQKTELNGSGLEYLYRTVFCILQATRTIQKLEELVVKFTTITVFVLNFRSDQPEQTYIAVHNTPE